ncbi:hypothetical protein GXM_03533 [Nostoc sphaeroides CCNUC1]|uniref:Uncharacterized protein n=1 Tax=Nostoc sphaeroides CCNUC1 TaxID=2653204 RepID=A0A5P8W047_9NOSO|nr:hypothetical protein GXM_03533 [Nostoc sphaeroides CCNUC1]
MGLDIASQGYNLSLNRYKRLFEKWFAVTLGTFRSPLTPLKKGGTGIKVPQFIGGFRGI